MLGHVVLLGDSIFDNAAYTAGGHAVIDHLHAQLPQSWQATCLAVDGSLIVDVARQYMQIPSDATHVVISIGGNNALEQSNFISESAASVAEVLYRMHGISAAFAAAYATMLDSVMAHNLPVAVCTVYDPHFANADVQTLMTTGLSMFNDAILRIAIARGLPIIDLRQICTTSADYANEIEPSVAGGAKIAAAIVTLLASYDATQPRSIVYAASST